MLLQLLTAVLVVQLMYFWWRLKNWKILKLSRQIKCDYKALPFLGHLYMLRGNAVDRMKGFQLIGYESLKQGGMASFWVGSNYNIMVTDPVVIELISKTCLEKDDIVRFARRVTGNGTVFAPVPIWRPRRKCLAPTFSQRNLNRFVDVFSRQSRIMVEQLKKMEGRSAFSIWQYITTYSMDSVCETTLGVNVNAQTQNDQQFLSVFEQVSRLVAERMVTLWYYPDFIYKFLPHYKRFSNATKVMYDFVDKLISTKRRSIEEDRNKSNSEQNEDSQENFKTFLQLLIESADGGYTNLELREEILTLLIAGTDTSAVGAAFTSVMLARNPRVQEDVYKEIREVFGDSDKPVTSEDLPKLKYLDAVIKETLRVYPPAPIIVRKVEKDIKLPSGLTLVPGCSMIFNIWALHRNPQYWGADAEQFRPERFLEAPLKHPAAYLPFSYGPRSCLGYQYAMMSMKTTLSTLLRSYRLISSAPAEDGGRHPPLRLAFDIMMKDADQFMLRLEDRKKIR